MSNPMTQYSFSLHRKKKNDQQKKQTIRRMSVVCLQLRSSTSPSDKKNGQQVLHTYHTAIIVVPIQQGNTPT